MKTTIFCVILIGSAIGGYFGYQYYYVETLWLSEIIDAKDSSITKIAVNIFDYNTELSRHDLQSIKSSKDYWLNRVAEIDLIQDKDLKKKENEKLVEEILQDPAMKKIFKGTVSKTAEFIKELLNYNK